MNPLHGGWAVVTGASSGIGAAVADRLAREGARLLLVGRDRTRLDAVAARTGGCPVVADLREPAGVPAICDAVRDAVGDPGGGLALLVHSAGVGAAAPLDATPVPVVDELLAVNLAAPVQITRALLPALRAGRGRVVFVASVAALGVADEAVYSATKAGLRGFADALRVESDLGVTTVLPGAVDTAYFTRRGQPYHRRLPRPVSPDRVAAALLDAVRRDRAEVFVPRWLAVAARIHGVAPATFARLSRRADRR